jgi:hypothetical protein
MKLGCGGEGRRQCERPERESRRGLDSRLWSPHSCFCHMVLGDSCASLKSQDRSEEAVFITVYVTQHVHTDRGGTARFSSGSEV